MNKGYIINFLDSMAFVPEEPAAMIRIHDWETRDYADARGNWDNSPASPIVESPLWKNVFSYRFSDIDPDTYETVQGAQREAALLEAAGLREEFGPGGVSGYRLLGPEKAKQMLEDFRNIDPSVTTYVFHCHAGWSRSPAVAQAMNEIFKLNLQWQGKAVRLMSVRSKKTAVNGKGIVGNLSVYNALVAAAKTLNG